MAGENLQQDIQKLLSTSSPIKARALATILSREFGLHVDRSNINSALYSMMHDGLVKRNDNYEWSLSEQGKQDNITSYPPAEPEIIFTAEQQAVINLVNNAIKYSNGDSEIIITTLKENNEVKIMVEDQGSGIPEEHLSRLFERFYRVDKARSRAVGGTGLGLSIVKHIA